MSYSLAKAKTKGLGISPLQVNNLIAAGLLRSDVEVAAWKEGRRGRTTALRVQFSDSNPEGGNVVVRLLKDANELAEKEYDRGYQAGWEDAEEDLG